MACSSALGLLSSAYTEDADSDPEPPAVTSTIVVNAAPTVVENAPPAGQLSEFNAIKEDKKYGQQVMHSNPEYEAMWAPVAGPALQPEQLRAAGIKSKSRFVASAHALLTRRARLTMRMRRVCTRLLFASARRSHLGTRRLRRPHRLRRLVP